MKNVKKVLIVDDNVDLCELLSHIIEKEGFLPQIVHEGENALKMVKSQRPDAVLLDIKMPGLDGLEVLGRIKELDKDLPVIMITAYADIHEAVWAIRAGAFDYLPKPFDNQAVAQAISRALTERNLKQRLRDLSTQLQEVPILRELMGPSDSIARLDSEINRVAKSDFTVVILGETGSGKELVAQAIHSMSNRSHAAFIPVDCGAIPESLLESELFGHEKGAFTGAIIQKPGKFEIANNGTLFLDEISNMPLGSQAKLLRLLQDKIVYRVGGIKPIHVDVRLLVASNEDLKSLAESLSFRRDLFYRMNEFTIIVPPLRERREDIPYLAKRFLDSANIELKKSIKGFTESAIETMLTSNWPGNVRQLRATIRRAVLLADELVTEKHLDLERGPKTPAVFKPKAMEMGWDKFSLKEIVRRTSIALERDVLCDVLEKVGGNKAKAARLLKIDYKTIHSKIKQYGIMVKDAVIDKTLTK